VGGRLVEACYEVDRDCPSSSSFQIQCGNAGKAALWYWQLHCNGKLQQRQNALIRHDQHGGSWRDLAIFNSPVASFAPATRSNFDWTTGAKERPDLPSAQREIDWKCNRPPTATLVTHAMSRLTKRDFATALFGSLVVAVVFLAVAFYVVRFYDDEGQCDRACIAESGEEP
jgi:hypothetical protein